jgi:hypothetical protein
MNQHEYVLGCQRYYAENGYEPGNPEDGEWHDCHYPVPKCLGGTKTIKLLKQHHAVQGVLQSEEYQHCCIRTWELAYLDGELLALARKWRSNLGRLAGKRSAALLTPEERSLKMRRAGQRRQETITGEDIRAFQEGRKRYLETLTPDDIRRNFDAAPEVKSERSRRSWETRRANYTEEQITAQASRNGALGRKAKLEKYTPEERSEHSRKAWETRRRNEALRRARSESNTDAPGGM